MDGVMVDSTGDVTAALRDESMMRRTVVALVAMMVAKMAVKETLSA